MPVFQYKGYRIDGRQIAGAIEAASISDAVVRIRAEGILPSNVAEPVIAHKRKRLFHKADETFLLNMTRQLSILLSSGVPMIDALTSLSAECEGFYRDMLIAIKERVSGGAGLYRAMEDFGEYFPEFYVSMIQAGEVSGTLDVVLLRLADFLEKQNTIKSRVRTAMMYPMFMAGVGIIVLSFLFTLVIPKIVKIFEDTKAALPFITTVLIFVSNIFVKYWWLLGGAAVAGYVYTKRFVKKHRLFVDRQILRLPGNIMQSLYYSRFARTLSFLLAGGLPMLKALKLSAKSIGNAELESSILNAVEKVTEGQRLSSSLEKFPPIFLQLVATGEKSGRLAEVLDKAANSYEEDFNRKVQRAVSLLEPSMILIMGVVVGIIVLAVLLPMFQLNQLIK